MTYTVLVRRTTLPLPPKKQKQNNNKGNKKPKTNINPYCKERQK
jgi:hypothetical protein